MYLLSNTSPKISVSTTCLLDGHINMSFFLQGVHKNQHLLIRLVCVKVSSRPTLHKKEKATLEGALQSKNSFSGRRLHRYLLKSLKNTSLRNFLLQRIPPKDAIPLLLSNETSMLFRLPSLHTPP